MASNIKYSVSATPIYELEDSEASGTMRSIAADVGRTVGGSGSVSCGFGPALNGYAAAAPVYASSADVITISGTALPIDTFDSVKFVFIKHSGYLWDDASTLGPATDKELYIYTEQTISADTTIAVLSPGDSIILPFNVATTPTFWSGADGVFVAVEYLSVTDAV